MKTPLTIIDGYAQMILDECNADEKLIISAASKIKRQSNKLNHVIVDILEMVEKKYYFLQVEKL